MRRLIKSLLAVLAIYLFLLFSMHSLGQLRGKLYGDAQVEKVEKSYQYMSTYPIVME